MNSPPKGQDPGRAPAANDGRPTTANFRFTLASLFWVITLVAVLLALAPRSPIDALLILVAPALVRTLAASRVERAEAKRFTVTETLDTFKASMEVVLLIFIAAAYAMFFGGAIGYGLGFDGLWPIHIAVASGLTVATGLFYRTWPRRKTTRATTAAAQFTTRYSQGFSRVGSLDRMRGVKRGGEDLAYELPLQRIHRLTNLLVVVLGGLHVAVGVLLVSRLGWKLLLGMGLIWLGLLMMVVGKHASAHPVSRARHSCVINCLSLCLDFVGYPWDVKHLESELRLNQAVRGTSIQNLLSLLSLHGIDHHTFACPSSQALREVLHTDRVPAIALIPQPILMDPRGWGIVLTPLQTLAWWLGKRDPQAPKHTVVVHGVVGDKVCIYDSATGTFHRVRWSWLSQRLVSAAFGGKPFLAVP